MKNLKDLEDLDPKKIFEIPSSVTSLRFSKQRPDQPKYLAVGVHTGFDNLTPRRPIGRIRP